MEVVDAEEPRAERLAALEEVVQVAAAEGPAGRAGAARVERVVDGRVGPARDAHAPGRGEGRPLPGEVRRQDAVEHVDAAADGVQEIGRRADAHQVARRRLGKEVDREAGDLLALGPRVAHRQAADREAVERMLGEEGGRLPPQRRDHPPLHDREQRLRRVLARGEAAQRPAVRALHGGAHGGLLGRRVDAHVEHHHDVRPDRRLHLDRRLGREEVEAAVDVAAKARAALVDGAVARQREDLIAARVGEHGPRPAHELVDAADAPEQLGPRPQQQVIGVRQQDRRVDASAGRRASARSPWRASPPA